MVQIRPFANDQYFKFTVHNVIKRTLEQNTYIVRQQLGDEQFTLSSPKEQLKKGDISIAQKNLYFRSCLRGTDQYWAQGSKELRSLVQFKINEGSGHPSFFATGTCAEYHFKALKWLLEIYTFQTSMQQ